MPVTAAALLNRSPHEGRPPLRLLGADIALSEGRLHEVCGPARWSFAAWVASAIQAAQPAREGPVLWLHLGWQGRVINPDGLAVFCAPERFVFVDVARMEDMLWAMEDALRSGAVPLVVADAAHLPSLTQVRRLHLACEHGAAVFGMAPLGLMLTPGPEGGAPGVESRWHLAPDHGPGRMAWQLARLRARTAPQAHFDVTLGANGLRCRAAGK